MVRATLPLLLLLLTCCWTAAHTAALVEHSLDAGQSFSTAGRIRLDEADAVSGIFEREPISSTQLSQLQQLVESDRCAAVGGFPGDGRPPWLLYIGHKTRTHKPGLLNHHTCC